MQENDVKVGDVVAWDAVPSGALVRAWPYIFKPHADGESIEVAGDYYLRLRDLVHDVGDALLAEWSSWGDLGGDEMATWWADFEAQGDDNDNTVIIALGLTGQETASDLQRLAEVYEVREALDWRVMDFGKPPPGYTVRNTSYEDGDNEVGGYGIMIEEWSWCDGGGYTDSAPTEAGCILSAWEFFEEENQPPGLNPYSGPQAWSWYRGRCAEGGDIAERLHAAGWRPGMTAEDAARLLAEVRGSLPAPWP